VIYDHKVRVFIEIFVTEHRSVLAEVQKCHKRDRSSFPCYHREACLCIFVQVPPIDYVTPHVLAAFSKIQ